VTPMSDEDAPLCGICGKPKLPGTFTRGQDVQRIWMCGTLQFDHDQMIAYGLQGTSQEESDGVEWDEDEMGWEDV